MDGSKTDALLFASPQLGTFRSPEGEYFVEPLHSYQGEHYEEEHTKPHIVYRKSAPKKHASGESSACDTSGTTFGATLAPLHMDLTEKWTCALLSLALRANTGM